MNRLILRLFDTSPLDAVRVIRSTTRKIGNSWTKPVIPQFDNVRFSGKLVCGKEPEHYRDFPRVESVSNWAKSRGVSLAIVKPEDFGHISWHDVNAVWLPFINPGENEHLATRCEEVLNIPEHIPLILDISSNQKHPWLKFIREHLSQRPLACRDMSPFETGDLFQVKVQFAHWPTDLPHSDVKDVIMIDVHHWEALSRHIQVLGLLDEFGRSYETACRMADCKLKFFLTCFTPLDPYVAAIDYFTGSMKAREHYLNVIRDNLIAPTETREEYLQLLSRTRLFVTFHTNLTDMGLLEPLANEIPTAILPNSFTGNSVSHLWVPNRREVPGYEKWVRTVERSLISLEGRDLAFLRNAWPSMNSKEMLRYVFCDSWDTLWKWVECR